jgi:hypothetical protein
MQLVLDFNSNSVHNSLMMIDKGNTMKTVYKSKSQLRAETADSVEAFLRAGGTIEVVKARKAPKQKMKAKSTRSPAKSTSGFAMGYRSSSI